MGSIVDILNRVRDMLMLVIGSLSLVMLTVGGIRYVAAGGDKEGVTARSRPLSTLSSAWEWQSWRRC